jgi:hypothetical protein
MVSVIIPLNDAWKWTAFYANEGVHVVTWNATRIVKCPRCHREYRISPDEFTAPNRCDTERCGYEGRVEQVGLQQPIFGVYGVEVKVREPRPRRKNGILEKVQYELSNIAEALGPEWDRAEAPKFSLTLWKSISLSGQLTELNLSPPQFQAISGFYGRVEYYNEVFDSMMGLRVNSLDHIRALVKLEKARQILLEDIPVVKQRMGWT